MLKLSLLQAFRHLRKQKFFSSLNIIGLSLGIASSIWLILFLQNELTFDQHFSDHERIFRVGHTFKAPGVEFNTAYSPSELSPMLKDRFPEIESFARFLSTQVPEIKHNDQVFTEQRMYYTDPAALDVFSIPLLSGDEQNALSSPNSMIISKSLAEKIFGKAEPLGKILKVNRRDVQITGVFEDLPANTHFQFEGLLSGVRDRGFAMQDGVFNSEALWNPDCINYIKFVSTDAKNNFVQKFPGFDKEFFAPFGEMINGEHILYLQQLDKIHYDDLALDDDFAKGNKANILVFSVIGISILLLACINYINMATAQASLRAKEIGVRKVLGTDIGRLRLSLLIESMVQVLIAFTIGIFLIQMLIDHSPLQNWLGVNFEFTLFQQPSIFFLAICLALATGLLAGIYPALYLSKIGTVRALKGNWVAGKGGNWLRHVLVTFQFVISIGVLISTFLMKDQINYLQNRSMGFAQDQLLMVNLRDSLAQTKFSVLKNQLEQASAIAGVTSSTFVPVEGIGTMVFKIEKEGEMLQQEFKYINGGTDYIETLGIELTKGRFFDENITDNSQYFVVNQTTANLLGWDDPVGKKMGFFHQENPGQVIGVVKDFNFFSLHNPIEPLVMVFNRNPGQNLIIRFEQDQGQEAIAALNGVWTDVVPNYPLDYRFLNESLRAQYESDETQNKLVGFMTALCITISLIGLMGLTAFNLDQKRKEIGIRKVLGAMSVQIVGLIYGNTLKLLLISSFIAVPIAYYAMNQWYQNFEYQTNINILLIFTGIISAVLITLVLVSTFVLNTARKNPTTALRSE